MLLGVFEEDLFNPKYNSTGQNDDPKWQKDNSTGQKDDSMGQKDNSTTQKDDSKGQTEKDLKLSSWVIFYFLLVMSLSKIVIRALKKSSPD